MRSKVKAGALLVDRAKAAVHKESRMQATKKIKDNQAVNFFKTSAVEVPNKDG